MENSQAQTERLVLIVEPESLLAAGLAHLMQRETGVRTMVASSRAECCRAIARYRPDVVIVPSSGLRFTERELALLLEVQPAPRIILVSPDCNDACVYDLASVRLNNIHDLLLLVHGSGEDSRQRQGGERKETRSG